MAETISKNLIHEDMILQHMHVNIKCPKCGLYALYGDLTYGGCLFSYVKCEKCGYKAYGAYNPLESAVYRTEELNKRVLDGGDILY